MHCTYEPDAVFGYDYFFHLKPQIKNDKSDRMEYQSEVEANFGFKNDELAANLSKVNLKDLPEEYITKIGLICALSDDEEVRKTAGKVINIIKKKHDRSGPFMLLKWVMRTKEGQEGLDEQLKDWSENHPDQIVYSRILLSLNTSDNITLIGAYTKHLEQFWDDERAWIQLGQLYEKEKFIDRAAFAYEEAIALNPKNADTYVKAAKARVANGNEDIARKQLSKAILLDNKNIDAINALIKLDGPNKEKLIKYKKLLVE